MAVLLVTTALFTTITAASSNAGVPPRLEATSVALEPGTACQPAVEPDQPFGRVAEMPALAVGLRTDGAVEHLEGQISGIHEYTATPLSEPAGVGPIDGIISVEVPVPRVLTSVQLLVWMGPVEPGPDTAVEWSVFYGCDDDGQAVIGASCFGPYGSCPRTARDTHEMLIEVDRGAPTVVPGGAIETSLAGCWAFDVGLFLTIPGRTLDQEPGNDWPGSYHGKPGKEPLTASLDVPADIAPGTVLDLHAYCGNLFPGSFIERWTAVVVAGDTISNQTLPAAPVKAQPAFTG